MTRRLCYHKEPSRTCCLALKQFNSKNTTPRDYISRRHRHAGDRISRHYRPAAVYRLWDYTAHYYAGVTVVARCPPDSARVRYETRHCTRWSHMTAATVAGFPRMLGRTYTRGRPDVYYYSEDMTLCILGHHRYKYQWSPCPVGPELWIQVLT